MSTQSQENEAGQATPKPQGSGQIWSPSLYDNYHRYVSRYGGDLLKFLDAKPGEMILDIGCGTADLTHRIAQTGAEIVGIDFSMDMLAAGRDKYPELDLRYMHAERMIFENEFDAIFSNAAMHWIKDQEPVCAGMYRALKPGGRFVIECGGIGCCETIYSMLREEIRQAGYEPVQTHWFRTIGEYAGLLERGGLRVDGAFLFDRDTALTGHHGMVNYLAMFGRGIAANVPPADQLTIFYKTAEKLQPLLLRDNVWHADYVRLRVKGRKLPQT